MQLARIYHLAYITVVGVPCGIIDTIGGFRLFRKYGFKDIPENIWGRRVAKKPLEILAVGIFMLIFSL